MSRTAVVRIGVSRNGRPGAELATPYHPIWVEKFKAMVPHTERAWVSETKVWWVSEKFRAVAEHLAMGFFKSLRIEGDPELGTYTIDQHGVIHQQRELF